MILYNITCIIEDDLANDFVGYLKDNYLDKYAPNPVISQIKLFRVLNSPNEGVSLSLQIEFSDEQQAKALKEELILPLQTLMQSNYRNRLFIFDTSMALIS